MLSAPKPRDEDIRLRALHHLGVLDTAAEDEFDALIKVASAVCGTPISLLSLVDTERQWFKANVGLPGVSETARDVAFCSHAILGDDILEVPDATADFRFFDNPLVKGNPDIRFYAGAPLKLSDGSRVGTLCVIDREPKSLTTFQREILSQLAIAASRALESRRALISERRLLETERLSTAIMYCSADTIIGLSLDRTVTHWNPAASRLFGYSDSEMVGQSIEKLIPDELRDENDLHFLTATYAKVTDTAFDTKRRHADGHLIDVSISIAPILGGEGELLGFTKMYRDITEKIKSAEALEKSEALFRTLSEFSPLGIFSTDLDGNCLYTNRRWQEIYGLTFEQSLGQGWLTPLHPDDAEQIAEEWRHAALLNGKFDFEFRLLKNDGSVSYVHSRSSELKVGELVTGYVGIVEDVTIRKLNEETLRKSQSFLDRTGSLAGVGGWEVDLTTNKITWSDQTYRIHGVPVGQEQTLESAISFYAPGARPIIQAAVSNAIETGAGWDMELPFNRMNGESIWVRVVGNVDFENGDPVRIVGAFQDVTFARAQRLQLEDAIDRFSLATESGQIGIWEYNLIDQTLIWDPLMYQIYGVTNSSPLEPYQLWAQQIHPDDLQSTELALSQAIQGGTPFDFEFRLIWPDASVRHVRATARIQRDESGTPLKVVGANWDITKLRRLTAQLAEQHELLQVTLQSIGDAVITTDSKGAVSWLNPVAERMTGWLSSEAIGRPLTQIFNIVNEDTRKPTENPVATCMSQGKIVGLANHTVLISRDGEEFGIEDSAAPILNKSGELLGVVLVFHDVTEQRRLSGEMSFRATHDSLTGLVNRAEFEARLRKTLNSAHEDRSEHALMYIDLDQFKLVNDACGHSAGDQLLQQISKLLLETVRARDTLARLGGDEFAVILEHCSTEQAQRVAQQICDRMDDYRFVHDGKRFRIGASIGLVPVDLRWKNAAAILQAADTSCYAAKEAGRNRVHAWFDTDLAMRARHGEMQWAARIEQAIDENRFVLFAQKIVPLNDKEKGMHAEVLIRMLDEDRSIVPPGAFLPAAERFHLASRIDRWVLQHTLEWIKNLNDLQLVNTISVNLSGQSIGDRAFHAHAIETLRAAGHLICTKLCFEITETAAITNMADATIFIEQVRALGVKTALDDFGAGASSFGYLKSLSVDFLKIDGQFVKDIIDDPMDDVAVKCFAEVAKVVGVKTVAEFVDKPEVLSRLRDIGIDYAQGFLLHKPAPIDDLFLIGERVLN